MVDLKSIPEALEYVEGFSRVDWDRCRTVHQHNSSPGGSRRGMDGVALQWIGILRDELGGSYRLSESDDYVLLSEYNDEQVKYLLGVTAKAHSIIFVNLGHLAANEVGHGTFSSSFPTWTITITTLPTFSVALTFRRPGGSISILDTGISRCQTVVRRMRR
jgi:hypothetical protein